MTRRVTVCLTDGTYLNQREVQRHTYCGRLDDFPSSAVIFARYKRRPLAVCPDCWRVYRDLELYAKLYPAKAKS